MKSLQEFLTEDKEESLDERAPRIKTVGVKIRKGQFKNNYAVIKGKPIYGTDTISFKVDILEDQIGKASIATPTMTLSELDKIL